MLHARIEAREAGRDPAWYLGAATELHDKMERQAVEDHVVVNNGRPARGVAAEALQLAGWLPKEDR